MITVENYLKHEVVNIHEKIEKPLIYSLKVESQLINYAKQGFPFEIVGFLFGRNNEVTELLPVENLAKNKERRFEINPLDYLRAENYAIHHDLELIGIYHSHPDHPAIPSSTDLVFAQEGFSYPIISVQASGEVQINAWQLEEGRFKQQFITIKN